MNLSFKTGPLPTRDELVALYNSTGWTAYTQNPAQLEAAIAGSLNVVTAWDGTQLVGLARIVGDGHTIAYLQDILVAPTHQRQGIGRELFQRAFSPYDDVRQKLLITDDEPRQAAFYEAMGFTEFSALKHPIRGFAKFS